MITLQRRKIEYLMAIMGVLVVFFLAGFLGLLLLLIGYICYKRGLFPYLRETNRFVKDALKVLFDSLVLLIVGLSFDIDVGRILWFALACNTSIVTFGIQKEALVSFSETTVIRLSLALLVGYLAFISLSMFSLDGRITIAAIKILLEENSLLALVSLSILPFRAIVSYLIRSDPNVSNIQDIIVALTDENEKDIPEYCSILLRNGYSTKALISNKARYKGRYIKGIPVLQLSDVINNSRSDQLPTAFLLGNERFDKELKEYHFLLGEAGFDVRIVGNLKQTIAEYLANGDNEARALNRIIKQNELEGELELGDALNKSLTYLVTGGAGSIGSEIVRKLVSAKVKSVIVLDNSEYNIYRLKEEFSLLADIHTEITYLLRDVVYKSDLQGILESSLVDVVFHAAALKHVPLIEDNEEIAYRVNVSGTKNLLEIASESGVKYFGYISTDKAVAPSNFMGLTKRYAEQLVYNYGCSNKNCRYSIVRFGNVIGSSGSVLPKFARQIRDGQAITITHRKMDRYFMTISEAANLLIAATVLIEPGPDEGANTYVLDMGDPVKLTDVVERMVQFSGKRLVEQASSEDDLVLKYTGTRKGEKLTESLTEGESLMATSVEKIKRLKRDGDFSTENLQQGIDVMGNKGLGRERWREFELRFKNRDSIVDR